MTPTIHPAVQQFELWPGPAGYPWAATGIRLWTREGILRRVAPEHLICTWTTGGFSEPTEGNFTMGAICAGRMRGISSSRRSSSCPMAG